MNIRYTIWMFAGLVLWLCTVNRLDAAQKDAAGIEFFETKIRPVLVKHCYDCHSAKATKVKGGLLLDTKAGALAGGDNGPVIVPGKPNESRLIKSLRHQDNLKMPSQKERLPEAVVQDFIEWISMGAPGLRDGQAAAKGYKGMTREEAKYFWAFQTPKKADAPKTNNTSWAKSPIDQFLLARMEEKKLQPVADAAPATLLRRLTFDLIGLPPTPEEIAAFGKESPQAALEKVVDRLLASPHFGERWGRHWLDIARYAETNGNLIDASFPNAYRYRDYVIAAYNSDKPYDRFIQEQIAGDLLPAKDDAEKRQNLIATGFLALTSRPPPQSPEFKFDLIADQIDVTTRAVLGQSVLCARCHDHKFDPISTKDYYALAAIFESSVMMYGPYGRDTSKSASLLSLPGGGEAMGIREGTPSDTNVRIRGETKQLGEKVQRGYLTVLTTETTPKINRNQSGRLELAQALTAPDSPLTARIAVNRIWQHLFGHGLVRTPDNFGSLGETPSHPELLDYLAVRFMVNGWSTKRMIKEIVLSRAYQLSSGHHEANHKIDPDASYLWRMPMRRLEAEAIRDAVLAVSGKLDPRPFQGTMLDTVKQDPRRGASDSGSVVENPYHRSIYLPMRRIRGLPEILALFDVANPNLVMAQRDVTTDPAQALFMINSPFIAEQSKFFAVRLLAHKDLDDAGRVNLAYQIALGRNATEKEQQRAVRYVGETQQSLGAGSEVRAWAIYCHTLYASAEFRYLR